MPRITKKSKRTYKKSKKGGTRFNNVINNIDNKLDKYNCSKNSFISCNNNCKWSWKGNSSFGECNPKITVDSSDNFMENMHTEFTELNEKIKILNKYIIDIDITKQDKINALKEERIHIINSLEELIKTDEKIEESYDSLNNNINSRKKITSKQIKLRQEVRELQLKRDNIETILRIYDNSARDFNNYNN
jgi:hypothetical protein